jgi:serine/threonine protein kinase/Tfp pilus assembly protein PilF
MALVPGTRLGPYEICAQIGQGGMGEVYRARDTRLERDVAIKILAETVATDPDRVERFNREARAVAALNHPNICQIHDVGPGYLVFEYVDGVLPQGPLASDKTLRIGVQIASALEAAHRRGILHTDLKPTNMLLTADGTVKLLDFGLARLIAPDSGSSDVTHTADGVVRGTAAYMAPEQAEGKALDQRADVFSYGAVLYELITGQRAFQGDSVAAVWGAVLYGGPPPLHGSPLGRIVNRCLEKDRSNRYQSMAEVRSALEDVSRSQRDPELSIAVLPFANLSDERDNEYFADGLTEEIINLLVQISDLRVIARTSAFAFKGQNTDIRHIAKTLGVVHVVEGSVRKAGDRIRITAQLINADNGFHIWSERYDRTLREVFAVQDEVAAAIARALQIRLNREPLQVQRYTPKLAAYEAYLKSRYHLWKLTPESVALSREYCEKALAVDSRFALPRIALADRLLVLAASGQIPASEAMPEIRSEAQKALSLDPLLPEAHGMLGIVAAEFDHNWDAARGHFEEALARGAISSLVRHWYCHFYLQPIGRANEAADKMKHVLEEDPLSAQTHWGMGLYLLAAGADAQATHEFHRSLEIDENFWPSLMQLAFFHVVHGRVDEALASAQKAHALFPWFGMNVGLLAGILLRTGDTGRAQKLVQELQSREEYGLPAALGLFHLASGDCERATESFREAMAQCHPAVLTAVIRPYERLLRPTHGWPGLLRVLNLPNPGDHSTSANA